MTAPSFAGFREMHNESLSHRLWLFLELDRGPAYDLSNKNVDAAVSRKKLLARCLEQVMLG